MKKNPLLFTSLILSLYGLGISIANVGIPATRPTLEFIMLIKSDYLGLNLLYLFLIGFVAGVFFMKGLANKKKDQNRPEF